MNGERATRGGDFGSRRRKCLRRPVMILVSYTSFLSPAKTRALTKRNSIDSNSFMKTPPLPLYTLNFVVVCCTRLGDHAGLGTWTLGRSCIISHLILSLTSILSLCASNCIVSNHSSRSIPTIRSLFLSCSTTIVSILGLAINFISSYACARASWSIARCTKLRQRFVERFSIYSRGTRVQAHFVL